VKGFFDWLRWEMGRRIDPTPVIRLITLERFAKSALLIAAGVGLLVAGRRGYLDHLLLQAQVEFNLAGNRGLIAQAIRYALEQAIKFRPSRITLVGIAGILYGLLEASEGVGLLLRRRWAEYLVLLATVAFIPVEVHELVLRPSLLKALALLVNLLIALYLIWRKRLFMERQGRPSVEEHQAHAALPPALSKSLPPPARRA